jgi:hypothetical protein
MIQNHDDVNAEHGHMIFYMLWTRYATYRYKHYASDKRQNVINKALKTYVTYVFLYFYSTPSFYNTISKIATLQVFP